MCTFWKKIWILFLSICFLFLVGCEQQEDNVDQELKVSQADLSNQYDEAKEENITMDDSGIEGIAIAYDENSTLCGLYDSKKEEYIVEPQYQEIQPYSDNGLALVYDGDYYGYMDADGNIVIDFYFLSAQSFQDNGFAIAGTENGIGVIDEKGEYVVQPKYSELSWIDEHFLSYQDADNKLYGICDKQGTIISEPCYENIFMEENYIYALIEDQPDSYFVYSKDGKPMFGEGTDLEQIQCIQLNPYGIYLALCYGESEPNVYGFQYKLSASEIDSWWRCYLDSEFEILSYGPYQEAKQFNSSGYAIVSIRHDWYGHETWGVIDKEGNYICDLPELDLGHAENWYTECNGFFAVARGYTGSYGMITEQVDALVDIKTQEIIPYQSIEFVESTNCTIVQDVDTNLYGLYVNNILTLSCIYDNITINDNDKIVTLRGSKQETISIADIVDSEQGVETSLTPVLIDEALKYMQKNYPSDNITELELYAEKDGIIICNVYSSGFTAFIGAEINKETKEVQLFNDSGRVIDHFKL
jgi:hypothetical protein